ncbi:MAG TPA: hypothetical protein VLZ12_11860 [Verrucomicrobiae bacterium]|nr:hypothetical protein [Verrucomicrobiae bacterium]
MTGKESNDRDEQAAWELLGRHQSIEPSYGFVERTLRRLDETLVAPQQRFWHLPAFRWAMAMSFAIVLGLSAWLTWQHVQAIRGADVYAHLQQDRLEDFDVIASLDQIVGGNK